MSWLAHELAKRLFKNGELVKFTTEAALASNAQPLEASQLGIYEVLMHIPGMAPKELDIYWNLAWCEEQEVLEDRMTWVLLPPAR
jgi:hypothetical protein